MERSPHQPGCAGQVKFSKAEAQVRRESWCWYQQGGCTDGLSTQPCPAHIHLHLSPTAPASRSTRRWKMRNASHCSWAKPCYCKERRRATARKGTVPSRHYLGARGGLGRARARPGMEKSPLPPCSQRQPGPGWELYLWHRWLRAASPLSSCLCSEEAVPTSSPLGICALVN